MDRSHHWDAIYTKREAEEVSWYEAIPTASIQRVREAVERGARSVIDIGGGASRLVDHLVEMDLDRITVLDISRRALDIARRRVGTAGEAVEWIVGDVTRLDDLGTFDVWHDRAVFHFLTEATDCRRYVALCERTVESGGIAVMATFAPDGPEMCSGLPVRRYDAQALSERCGIAFELIDDERHIHVTPAGVEQSFVYSSLRKVTSEARLAGATFVITPSLGRSFRARGADASPEGRRRGGSRRRPWRRRQAGSAVPQANATVLAPCMTSSTTLAAPTMTDPLRSCSSPMPRGFAQAPQTHTEPPLSMNSW